MWQIGAGIDFGKHVLQSSHAELESKVSYLLSGHGRAPLCGTMSEKLEACGESSHWQSSLHLFQSMDWSATRRSVISLNSMLDSYSRGSEWQLSVPWNEREEKTKTQTRSFWTWVSRLFAACLASQVKVFFWAENTHFPSALAMPWGAFLIFFSQMVGPTMFSISPFGESGEAADCCDLEEWHHFQLLHLFLGKL